MKNGTFKAALCCLVSCVFVSAFAGGSEVSPRPIPGIYVGAGASWNAVRIDNSVSTFNQLSAAGGANQDLYSLDNFSENDNKFAPVVDLGFWSPLGEQWLWGLQANYKYLNYRTPGSVTQLVNASPNFVSTNIVGATSTANLANRSKHELLLLTYFGRQFEHSYLYLGVGASMLTLKSSFFLQGYRNTANANQPIAQFEGAQSKTIWGWAAQLGYNYYFRPTWFLSLNYNYLGMGRNNFNTTTTREAVFGTNTPGGTGAITADRKATVSVQEVIFSINKVFGL